MRRAGCTPDSLRVWVLGPGALGTALGRLLASHGAEVLFVGRDGADRDPRTLGGPAEVVLVTVKSYQTEPAIRGLLADAAMRASIDEATTFVSLQNGIGNAEVLASHVGPARVMAGWTTHAGHRLVSGDVRHVAAGDTVIAGFGARAEATAEAAHAVAARLSRFGLVTRAAADCAALLWQKLVVSCGLNPVAALAGLTNGEALASPDAREVAIAAAREAAAVAHAAGVAPGVSAAELAQDAETRLLAVVRATAGNRCSMLQDLEAGRRTEVEALSGAVVVRAEALRVEVPVSRTLWRLVRSREAQAHGVLRTPADDPVLAPPEQCTDPPHPRPVREDDAVPKRTLVAHA